MGQVFFSGNSNYILDVDAAVVSQDIAANSSYIYWRAIVYKLAGSGIWGSDPSNVGQAGSSNGAPNNLWNISGFYYDFRNGSSTGTFTFAEGFFTLYHNADGTASYYVNGYMNLAGAGSAFTGSGTKELPRIPRGPRVKDAGVYKNTIAYVKDAGVYKIAIPYVKDASVYKIGGS